MNWLKQRFELQRGSGGHNVRSMEGLRGLAVFLVFLVHYVTLGKSWIEGEPVLLKFANVLFIFGNTGVDLFFILSGYLIYSSLLSRPQKFLSFMSRRVQRIYPTFLATFALYVALSFAFPSKNKIPSHVVGATIYLLENLLLLPGLFPIEPLITVAWSLSYEMFFYLTIPCVIAIFNFRARNVIWRVSFFAIVLGVTVTYCAIYGGYIRFIMFLSGIMLCEAINTSSIPAPNSSVGLLAFVVGLLGTLLPIGGSSGATLKSGILFVSFFVLCLVCFRRPSTWLPRALSWTPLRWLGNMSYSYYLLHGLTLNACFLAFSHVLPVGKHGPWLFLMLFPAIFLLSLVPTAILFLAVECPYSIAPRRTTRVDEKSPRECVSSDSVRAVPVVSS